MSTGRSHRGRYRSDADIAAGRAQHRVANLDTAAARSLRAPRRQRLLGASVAIGRRIEITADLSRVRVWCGGTLVADHDRIWAKHQTISDPEHVVAAKLLRRKRFDIVGPPHHVEVEQRLLTTYDTVLGLDGPVA